MTELKGGDLSVRGARGGGLVLVGSGATFVIQVASLLILSRLLTPSDFGLVAMVTIFVVLGNLLRDFGLPLAGLQEQSLSRQQASNLFWMSAATAAIFSILMAASTPALIDLFREPRLAQIVPALAISVFLGGMTSQLQVQLARNMQFGALVASDVIGQLAGLAVAIVLGIAGAGYWALVAQSLTAAALVLVYRWIASRWIPLAPSRGPDALRLFKIGATYSVAQLLAYVQSNIGTMLIGTQLGVTQLGYYNRAYQLLTAPAGRFLDPLTQVVISTLNRAKDEQRDPDALLCKIQFGVGSLIVWVFAVTAGTAPGLIPLVLGDQWRPAVTVFQILAIGGSVLVFNHVNYWAFIVKEQPRALLHYNLVSKPLEIASIFIGSQFGLDGVAWGYAAAVVFSWPLFLIWLSRATGLSTRRFFTNGCQILLAGVFGSAASAAVYLALAPLATFLCVLGGVFAGTIAFAAVLLAIPASRTQLADWSRLVRSALLRQREAL
ncbi:lipopolysaccharide biosynthesis protein [Arthrobacter sp. MI7-26]|uniref:lipopolysaccharide biosynthesis protein n=1 Tax=Arthrobacter sp. MI7-26 TaxID=2993653 RepID=UPI0022495049|nr:lipopolysaccharide biosynthesis protein [Arthrobacter sp. MI7-26]MCX2747048.1 lipopolysaccharide biosynthesis protein [Arthrobacter sp. MI7-26]